MPFVNCIQLIPLLETMIVINGICGNLFHLILGKGWITVVRKKNPVYEKNL